MSILLQGNSIGAINSAKTSGIAIVVDTLRASTTLPIAMHKGLKELYVSQEVEDAREAANLFNAILMGERGCLKLPGFTFGNSPKEIYSLTQFPSTTVVFTSSTGAKIVIESIGSSYTIIGSPINASAVARITIQLLNRQECDVYIIPAFTKGMIINSEITEDQIGGLLIAKEFIQAGFSLSSNITKEINYLTNLLKNNNLEALLRETTHGQKLRELSFNDDIEFCSRVNFIEDVPLSKNNVKTLPSGVKIACFKNRK